MCFIVKKEYVMKKFLLIALVVAIVFAGIYFTAVDHLGGLESTSKTTTRVSTEVEATTEPAAVKPKVKPSEKPGIPTMPDAPPDVKKK